MDPKLVARNPVKAAALMSSKVDISDLRGQIEEAEKNIETLVQFKSTLLPIEGGGAKFAQVVRKKQGELDNLRRLENNGKYPLFSLEHLLWRNANGYPRLAVFSLASDTFDLGVVGYRSSWRA